MVTTENVAVVSLQGLRPSMEDTHFIYIEDENYPRILGGIFDGHSGDHVAKMAAKLYQEKFYEGLKERNHGFYAENGHRHAYDEIQNASKVYWQGGGAVAATFYIWGDTVCVANAGDAHIVNVSERARLFTRDHRITDKDERERILSHGGEINGPYASFPDGPGLMPTRSLGDHLFTSIGLWHYPDVSSYMLEPGFLVCACDGLFDVMTPDDMLQLLHGVHSAKLAAEILADDALNVRGSTDNVSVMVVEV